MTEAKVDQATDPADQVPWTFNVASCERVIDGDTVVLRLTRVDNVDMGFHIHLTLTESTQQRMRLNRINCAPAGTPAGDEATQYVKNVLLGQSLGITVVDSYKYGDEWMAEITLSNGYNLSDMLVNVGLAVYWNGEGPRPDNIKPPATAPVAP